MAEMKWLRAGMALACLAVVAGCNGKPEEGGDSSDSTAATDAKTPPRAYPAWAAAMIGRPLAATGSTTCKGKIDAVTLKHTGARKGSDLEGWAWDQGGAKPFPKVVFTNAAGIVIGAAEVGSPRPDVLQAMPEVKTANLGWKGAIGALNGRFKAVGLSASGASCSFDSSVL